MIYGEGFLEEEKRFEDSIIRNKFRSFYSLVLD